MMSMSFLGVVRVMELHVATTHQLQGTQREKERVAEVGVDEIPAVRRCYML